MVPVGVVGSVPLPVPLSIVLSPDREVGVLPTTGVVMRMVVGGIRSGRTLDSNPTYVLELDGCRKT